MTPKVLLVSPPQRRSRLLEILGGALARMECASGYIDAREKLGAASYDLLLVDTELPDGSWRELLQFGRDSGKVIVAVVCSRVGARRLWSEALESGAYDFIAEPYEEQEIIRIVERVLDRASAWRTVATPA